MHFNAMMHTNVGKVGFQTSNELFHYSLIRNYRLNLMMILYIATLNGSKEFKGQSLQVLMCYIVAVKSGLMHVFSRFQFLLYSRSLKFPLHIYSYSLRFRLSVMEL